MEPIARTQVDRLLEDAHDAAWELMWETMRARERTRPTVAEIKAHAQVRVRQGSRAWLWKDEPLVTAKTEIEDGKVTVTIEARSREEKVDGEADRDSDEEGRAQGYRHRDEGQGAGERAEGEGGDED